MRVKNTAGYFNRIGALMLALGFCAALHAADDYHLGPDSQRHPGVPQGTVEKFTFTGSRLFPGTTRNWWVYVPAQYHASNAACLMVFQDGSGFVNPDGGWRVPIVFDNLIAKKQMPVTIGVFIDPGVVPASNENALPRYNRSFEYDGRGGRYARFLLEEILPEVLKKYNLAPDASSHAIAGASSGAVCAFTAAWERPDAFSRVFSAIGTYVGLRGGNEYPTLIRKTESKPLRIFLQDGTNDLNIYGGNWWLANQEMLSALEFSGYEVNHEWGTGGHSGKQGGAILPDALRWLWKDYPVMVQAGVNSKQPVMDVLIPGEGWKVAAQGLAFADSPAANDKGEIFFADVPTNRIYQIGFGGQVSLFATNSGGANALSFGPDGNLYAGQNYNRRIVRYNSLGDSTVIAEAQESGNLCISHDGKIYVTDPLHRQVWSVINGRKNLVDTGLQFPSGVQLTPDQSLLLVADMRGQFVSSFQVQPDGSLTNKQWYFDLHIPDAEADSGAGGMAVDADGRLYVATRLGVQICDQAGRVIGIISKPQDTVMSGLAFGGPNHDELYVTCADKVFKRKTKVHGVLSWQAPIKPAPPKL